MKILYKKIFYFLCLSWIGWGHAFAFTDQFPELLYAESDAPFSADTVKTKYSTWIVFQKACKSCHLMMREQSCFKSPKNAVNFVGVMADPEELVADVKAQNKKIKPLYSKVQIEIDLKLEVTPTVFIFKGKELVHRHDNFMDCKAIKEKLT